MTSKSRRQKRIKMALRTFTVASLMKLKKDYGLLVYVMLTFLIVVLLYILTYDWKGFTSPEEVDIGSVRMPMRARTCRRKHAHYSR